MKQHTIKSAFSLSGKGLHTGQEVTLTFQPAAPHHGYQFKRVDLEKQPTVKADVAAVKDTQRGTTLQSGDALVHTVEHVLSALAGLQIDNVLIELDGEEVPILDGSAAIYVEKLLAVGLEEQDAEREYLVIEAPIHYKDEATGTELLALPADDFHLTTLIDFNSPVLGEQYAQLSDLKAYAKEIAGARTFVFVHELEQLLDAGLIKGGALDNAIVIANEVMEQADLDALAAKLDRPSVKMTQAGILNTTDLRFTNEPARHKLLDVIGDLTLATRPIKGRIVATKPGHAANVAFARLLKKEFQAQRKLKGKPKYDSAAIPLFNTMQIAEKLPHRYPFLLVDKIMEMDENRIVGVKNITFNEQLFQGHFPGNPIFPGVLQLEALAQTGGLLALNKIDPTGEHDWDTYFVKIDNVKFKNMVHPGDTLLLKMEITAPIRRGMVQMHGIAYVGNKIASEGDLTAQIVRRK
ncbi:MAG: bifunctional UDP-3-O-[3-hydroxymyristoyl] N-acetylglucosamine deacetylase/3-hydroxyacyl-ACP dehydratase [Saprospiraceae bacterium]